MHRPDQGFCMTGLLSKLGGSAFHIEAEKSLLRALGEADLTDRYLGWLNDSESNRYSSRRGSSFTREDMTAYVEDANASPNMLLLGIFPHESDEHVGNILFDYYDRPNGIATLANLLGETSRWGGGYVVDADKHVIGFGFQKLGVRKFVLGNLAPNRASTFKSTTLGAQLEGRLRRHEALDGAYVDILKFGLFPEEFYARFPEMNKDA